MTARRLAPTSDRRSRRPAKAREEQAPTDLVHGGAAPRIPEPSDEAIDRFSGEGGAMRPTRRRSQRAAG